MHGFSKSWTEAELEDLGYNKVLIGVPGRPLPVMAANPAATTQEDAYRLEMIEDEQSPIILWSKRSYGEVVGMLYRLLPTPSMLPLFYETLQLLQVENDRRIQFYIGKHGSGKSFLGRLIGDMLHPDGAITINCADRDLNELLFETVLDVAANPDLYTQLNERLREGSLNPTSIAALKAVVGEAYLEKDGYPHIDFEKIGATELHTITNEDGQRETEAVFSGASTTEVVDTILRIAQVEGLSKEASFMPIKSQLGLLPKIWEEGRVAHLEEYNKCKEGTDTCLHPVLQVYNGEQRNCRVYGSGGLSFGFDNRDRQPGFFCYLDGNMKQDGVATHQLSASANDRILPNIIQDMIREDWQHRWCQMLTGLPLKILYQSKQDQWDADPESFTRFLHMIRGLGGVEVPQAHKHYIDRWEDILDATEIISRYNQLYDEMTNPDSAANKAGKYPELFTEVDEEFYNMAGGSMRRNIYYFKMALLGRPGTKQPHLSQGYDLSEDWNNPPALEVTRDHYRPEAQLGSHIVEIFLRDMIRLTLGLGKVNLYTRLKVAFETLRMMRPTLSEGAQLQGIYLEDLLNSEDTGSSRHSAVQKIFCAQLRQHFTGTPISKDDDHLMTLDQIEKALSAAGQNGIGESGDNRLRYMYAQHYAPLVTVDNMVMPVALLDSIATRHGAGLQVRDEDLMGHDHFLAALAIPGLGRKTRKALWNTALLDEFDSPVAAWDEALLICTNQSSAGIAFTTVLTKTGPDGATAHAPVHILRDGRKDSMLVIGEAVDDTLKSFLKEDNIEFVDRQAGNARARVQTFLNRTLIKATPETEQYLVGAFFHRNALASVDLKENIDQIDKLRLADLLIAPDVITARPNYATTLLDNKKIQAYLEQKIKQPEHV